MNPHLTFKNRKRRAVALLYGAHQFLDDRNEELHLGLIPLSPLIESLSKSLNAAPTEADQNLLIIKLDPILAILEQVISLDTLPSHSDIDQYAQDNRELTIDDQLSPSTATLQSHLLAILKNLKTTPSKDPTILHNGWKRLVVEFKDPTLRARRKRVGAVGSGISLTLWIIVLLYLTFGMPAWLRYLPTTGSRDFFWAAIFVGLLVGLTTSFIAKRSLLHFREILWTLCVVEGALLGSVWFMTGLNPLHQINLKYILIWFLYMQIFILLPWIGSWALVHWFWPPTKKE